MSKLVLIDGNAIMHRAYHAMPPLTTPENDPIGAVHGFLNIFLKILNDLEPTHLAVCWDRKEPTFRKKKYEDYQAHRPPTDEALSSQFEKIKKVLNAFGIVQHDKKGYEADDLIGTLSKKAKTDEVVIVTGDKDQLQLVNNKVKVFLPKRGLSNGTLYDAEEVRKKLGVKPEKVVDLKALMGDQSDNYPGIYGIGPKTAKRLIDKYDNYENIYKHLDELSENLKKKLKKGKEDGDISYELAKIITDLDVDYDDKDLGDWSLENEKVLKLFKSYGLKTLKRRIQGKKVKRINKSPKEKEIKKVVKKLAKLLKDENYAIRGTASLVLQGYDMGVDDIDVLTDKKTAVACNDILKDYLYEKVEYKRSDMYKSYFGKFVIDKILVEVYGEWQIRNSKSNSNSKNIWSERFVPDEDIITEVELSGVEIKVTKVEHELEVFALEGRWNAYHKLKKQVESKRQASLFD